MVFNESEKSAGPMVSPLQEKKDTAETGAAQLHTPEDKLKTFNKCFFKLGSRLNSVSDEKDAARIIADISLEIFPWKSFSLYTFNCHGGNFYKVLEINNPDFLHSHSNGTPGPEFSMFDVLTSGKKLFITTDGKSGYKYSEPFSAMIIPMKMGGKPVGIITVSATENIYSLKDAEFIEILSEYFCGAYERISSNRQLEALESQYQEIFENATIGVFQSTEDGTIIKANPAFASMLGYSSPNEVLKLNIERDIYADRNELLHILSRHKNEGYSFIDEIKWKTKNNSVIWVRITLYSITNTQGYEYYEGFVTPITETKVVKEKINCSLKEKEVLLKELHHRVKNNMQIISSLLNLQASYINKKNTEELFRESKNRIKSISLIHEMLYQSKDFALVDFRAYTDNFIYHIAASYDVNPGKIIFRTVIDNIQLSMDTAIPCGLILNEVISNSIKHAFPVTGTGQIYIEMNRKDDNFILRISDSGVGISDEQITREGLGIVIIRSLVQQLNGTLDFKSENGTIFIISFKDS